MVPASPQGELRAEVAPWRPHGRLRTRSAAPDDPRALAHLAARRLLEAATAELAHPPAPLARDTAGAFALDVRRTPHAFLLACALAGLDPRVDASRALYVLSRRLGHFDPARLATLAPEALAERFAWPTPLHPDPEAAGALVSRVVRVLFERYAGDAARLWLDRPPSATLIKRLLELGLSRPIAVAAAGVLARDFRVRLGDYASLDLVADVAAVRVFARLGLVADAAGPDAVVYAAREIAPEFPALLEAPVAELAASTCRAIEPRCDACPFEDVCAHARRRPAEPCLPFD